MAATKATAEAIPKNHRTKEPSEWGWSWFGLDREIQRLTVIETRTKHLRSKSDFQISLWLLVAGATLLPITRLSLFALKARRQRRGCCPSCGYNLCASPERCPECGAAAPKPDGSTQAP